jgi:hypothetical protein
MSGLIKDFKTFWGGAVAIATAGPLGLWVADLSPPWPQSAKAVTAAATLFCAAAVAIAVAIPMRAQRRRLVGTVAVLLGLILCIAYLWAYSDHVVSRTQIVDGKPHLRRWVTGSELQPGAAAHGLTKEELLEWSNFEPTAVWTPASVSAARLQLVLKFFVGFSLLTSGLALLSKSRAQARK